VAQLTSFTRYLYRKARDTHIAVLLSAAHAKTRLADRLLATAEAVQERANAARQHAVKANDHADLFWDAVDTEIELIDVAA